MCIYTHICKHLQFKNNKINNTKNPVQTIQINSSCFWPETTLSNSCTIWQYMLFSHDHQQNSWTFPSQWELWGHWSCKKTMNTGNTANSSANGFNKTAISISDPRLSQRAKKRRPWQNRQTDVIHSNWHKRNLNPLGHFTFWISLSPRPHTWDQMAQLWSLSRAEINQSQHCNSLTS